MTINLGFTKVLAANKTTPQRAPGLGIEMQAPAADYAFRESVKPRVRPSSVPTPGVQVADVVAGAAMRYARDVLAGVPQDERLSAALAKLFAVSDTPTGPGVNLIASTAAYQRLHLAAGGYLPARAGGRRP